MHPTIISTRTFIFFFFFCFFFPFFCWWTSSGRLSFLFRMERLNWRARIFFSLLFPSPDSIKWYMRRNEKWVSFAFYKTISRKVWHRWWQQRDDIDWRTRKIEMKGWKFTSWKLVCEMSLRQWFGVWCFGCIRVRTFSDTSSIKLMLSVSFLLSPLARNFIIDNIFPIQFSHSAFAGWLENWFKFCE